MELYGECGNNEYGQLGNGSNEESLVPVQVKIDENTPLTNIIKISVGTNHVLALTKDGKVYAWGSNGYGNLGIGGDKFSNYAKKVVGEGGQGSLSRIIDISAGNYGSAAVNEFGWSYIWGNGSFGELGNGRDISKNIPSKNSINTAISVSMGAGHGAIISQNANLYTFGRNLSGELGIRKYNQYEHYTKNIK